MDEFGHSIDSRTFPAPPEGELLVVLEEGFGSPARLHLEWLELFRRLPPPFQSVLDVSFDGNVVEVMLQRFIGVDASDLVRALERVGRVLPLDVWLALATRWAHALVQVPVGCDGWKTPAHLRQLGVDVRGALVLTFDQPNHVIGRSWNNPEAATRAGGYGHVPESMSPEAVRGLPIDEPARVYSLALTLLALLEGRRMFDQHESMISMIADIVLKGLEWAEPRNPQCTPGLHAVLRRATAMDPSARYPTIPEFLAAVAASTGVEPAPEARMFDVLLGVSPDMQSCLGKVEPWSLPPSWASGGVQVMQDRLLERLVPAASLPEATA